MYNSCVEQFTSSDIVHFKYFVFASTSSWYIYSLFQQLISIRSCLYLMFTLPRIGFLRVHGGNSAAVLVNCSRPFARGSLFLTVRSCSPFAFLIHLCLIVILWSRIEFNRGSNETSPPPEKGKVKQRQKKRGGRSSSLAQMRVARTSTLLENTSASGPR